MCPAPGGGAKTDTAAVHPRLAVARPALLRALRHVLAPDGGASTCPGAPQDPTGLLEAVRRHRLAIVLAPHTDALGWPEETAALVRQEARRQQLAALPLMATALEAQAALQAAGLRALLLKGPALALQTTGQAWSRGGGDVDLLVAPTDLPAAVAVLAELGFRGPPGHFPRDLGSFWGRYARWASHELSLWREGSPWLDLHWALCTPRARLPGFEALWREREVVTLNGRSVPTLSRRHAFLHGCLHAASDQWMDLRHLLDLARLASALPAEEREPLRHRIVVRQSCATADGAWHVGHWLQTVLQQASLSTSPIDWLRVIARFSLLPAAFNDPITGRDVGLAGMLRARQRRLRERLRERLRDSRSH